MQALKTRSISERKISARSGALTKELKTRIERPLPQTGMASLRGVPTGHSFLEKAIWPIHQEKPKRTVMHMSDSPVDIFQQLNELMKRLMEQGIKEQGDPNRPFAYGFKIVIHDASTTEASAEEPSPVSAAAESSPEGTLEPIAEMYMTDDDVTVAVDLLVSRRRAFICHSSMGTLTIIAGGSQPTSVEMPTVDADSMQSR